MCEESLEPRSLGNGVVELPAGFVVKIDGLPFQLTAPAYIDNSAGNLALAHSQDLFDIDSHK